MKCELISSLGDDLTVCNAARVSFDKESRWARDIRITGEKELNSGDKKLIKYLANHEHFTPFTHCMITMREEVPIFVARQRFKHTIGFSYNEVSRRYVDSDPLFFHPTLWRKKAENKKQGSEEDGIPSQNIINKSYDTFLIASKELYDNMLGMQVAPEQARMVLPQSMYTSYYVTGSLAAFARAYKLRIEEHAQKEIRDLAKMWDTICSDIYPVSWKELTSGS
jgi:thymidylate synthase (FAD)|tara:strand:- start:3717 stop:4385 length:669 start_codon:yes stop_codon:yes gene_type:complete